jgi:hypothetical protein
MNNKQWTSVVLLALAFPWAGSEARAAVDDQAEPGVVFPWRSDKQGDVMLLQKLMYKGNDGKARRRESVVRVIPAAQVKPVKAAATKLAKVKRKVAEWHVQKDGSVVLLQRRLGEGKDGKPAGETALIARVAPQAAGSFAGASIKPPAAPAGGRPDSYWSRGADGGFVLYQRGQRLPVSRVSPSRLRQSSYLDEDYDGTLEDDEVYSQEETEYLDELDHDDGAEFDADDDDYDDQDGDGLEDDDGDEDEDDGDEDEDDDEDGDLGDDGDDD